MAMTTQVNGEVSAKQAPPLVEVHDMTVAYHRRPVLWDVDLLFPQPRLVGIVGPNGAGKSTLLKAMVGLVPVASGEVRLLGRRLAEMRQLIGYVPQRTSIDWDFPISVFDVVLMGTYGKLGWIRRPGSAERDRARESLQRVGLQGLENRQISQLSGGQQQRTFLARALAQDAQVYFMDEPMAGVDAATERVVFTILHEFRDQGKLVLAVHHDLRTVPTYFDDVVLLNMRVVANGPVKQVFTPENLQKTYGGRLPILEATAEAVRRG
jgi:manganese/zinc/iron transport system ATP- binding protein